MINAHLTKSKKEHAQNNYKFSLDNYKSECVTGFSFKNKEGEIKKLNESVHENRLLIKLSKNLHEILKLPYPLFITKKSTPWHYPLSKSNPIIYTT